MRKLRATAALFFGTCDVPEDRPQSAGQFHRAMLAQGIYLPASQYEAWFLSAAHTQRHVDRTIAAARVAVADLG